jgi:glycosyltransferase involved in cell wall biosynthesis
MITYGHENYIEQAINSILIQKCDFDVELIIANDQRRAIPLTILEH